MKFRLSKWNFASWNRPPPHHLDHVSSSIFSKFLLKPNLNLTLSFNIKFIFLNFKLKPNKPHWESNVKKKPAMAI